MQSIQNIPTPDVEPNDVDEDFGSHSQVEQDLDNDENENIENPKDEGVENPQDINRERKPTSDTEQVPPSEYDIEKNQVHQSSMTF